MTQSDANPPTPPGGPAEWFRAIAEATSTSIFVFRELFLYINPASERLTGYTADELRQMSIWDLLHPDDHERARQHDAERRQGGGSADRDEIRIVRKNGDVRWVDFATSTIEIGGREATAGTAFDVTQRKLAEIALQESDERLNLAQRAGRSVSWEWDPATDRLDFSRYANELFGFPVREMVRTGDEFVRFIHPDDRERLRRALSRTLTSGTDLSLEIRCLPPNGSQRWLTENALAIRDESGWTRKLIGVAHDITERKISDEALFQEKERALVTLAAIADGVIRTDSQGTIDYLNPVAQRLTGWSMAEAYGRSVEEVYRVIGETGDRRAIHPVQRCLSEQRNILYPGDRYLERRDGTRFAVHDSAAPIRNRSGNLMGAILVFKDLTPLRQVEEQIMHLASHDPLTGLLNRRELEARLRGAIQSARGEGGPHAFCYLDLDQFKLVNDTCGHAAGDQLILQASSLIGSCLGSSDLLARLGDDDFGILMHDRDAKAARELMERVVTEVGKHRFSWQERLFPIALSGGLVTINADSRESSSVMSAADAACYVAKERGGDRIHEYRPGDTLIAERYGQMQWISRIHQAFDQDRFVIFQQRIEPITDSGADSFSELLIRLRNEAGEIAEPGQFIPAAEKYGLISSIDRWMVERALDCFSSPRLRASRPDLRFAINLSGQSLSEEGFLDFVVAQLDRTGVSPARIHFEITETSAIADLPHAIRFMSTLKTMGCRFVLDDFGKGLSSFSYLQNLPVDFLKIDGDFVRNLTADPIQRALVSSIHDIGRVLGLSTIAEAVEDEETLEALRTIGVDYAQGFFLSRPRPLEPRREPGREPRRDRPRSRSASSEVSSRDE